MVVPKTQVTAQLTALGTSLTHLNQARLSVVFKLKKHWLWSLGISVLWTNGAHEEAMTLADALIQEFPTHRLADDALYKRVSLELKRSQDPDQVFDSSGNS